MFGHHQHAADQLVGKRRLAGEQDDELGDVGGEDFAAEMDGPRKFVGARSHGFDHPLVGRTARELHAVPACRLDLAAADLAAQEFAAVQSHKALAAEPCNDGAV